MPMKVSVYLGDGNAVEIVAHFGEKLGYSPYFVTSSWTPSTVKDIIEFFTESTTEAAIKHVARRFQREIMNGERIALVTGDGQIIDLSIAKPEPVFDYVPKHDGD